MGATAEAREAARFVWTQSAFSEIASAAAFAGIAGCLLAAGAPVDFVAAAGDFVGDEVIHAELSGRMAMAFGGAAPMEVDLARLVRPPVSATPLLRAAELIVRTSCVGEALTVPVLKGAKAAAGSALAEAVIGRIVRDEAAHAEMGPWFLDWADAWLSDEDRAALGRNRGRCGARFCADPSGIARRRARAGGARLRHFRSDLPGRREAARGASARCARHRRARRGPRGRRGRIAGRGAPSARPDR